MSDLYQETSQADTAETGATGAPARDAESLQRYETGESAERGYGEYAETDAEVQARITGQDELPSHDESRHATWGDNPDYYDETELGAFYDGDAGAFLAAEDKLPTPQESRARTWGDNPEYYDETDLVSEHDGGLGALTTEGDGPAAHDAVTSPDAGSTHAELPAAGDGGVLSPEAGRLEAPETEPDAARQKISDLETELKAVKDDQAARLDRIEQLLASPDRQPGTSPDQDASLAAHEGTRQVNDAKNAEHAEHTRWRRAVSAENVGAAGTLVGAADTMAHFAMHAAPEGMVGLGAMVLGLASLGLAKAEKHRKGKA